MKTKIVKKIISIAVCSCILASNTVFADSPKFKIEMPSISSNVPYVISNGIVYNFIREPGSVSLGEVSVGNNQTIEISDVVIPNIITVKGKSYAVTEIEKNAFSTNHNIETISFGKSIEKLDSFSFFDCSNLKEINVSSDSPYFTSENGVLYGPSYKSLIKYPAGKEDSRYIANSSATEVSDFGFYGVKFLEDLSFQNLYKLGKYSLAQTSSIKNISLGINIEEIGDCAFQKSNIDSLLLPPTLKSIGKGAFAFSNISQISIPANVSAIKEGTFYDCENLSKVQIGSGVKSIEDYAFSNIKAEEIELPDAVNEIGKYSFAECSNLKKITLSKSLTKIGDYAFHNCILIKTIDIPKYVNQIGKEVFTGCTSLESFTAKSGQPKVCTIEDGILYNENVTKLIHYPAAYTSSIYTIPSSLKEIEENALSDCKYINEFSIETEGFNFYIEEGVLYDYHIEKLIKFPLGKGGSNYTIPDTVKEILPKALKNSDLSGTLNLPSGLEKIGDYAFEGCSNITSFQANGKNIISEDGVLYTSDKTELIQFPAKSAITNFEVPSSVTKIRPGAFKGSKIVSITLNDGLEEIGNYAFSETKIDSIQLPESLKIIGDKAFEKTNIKNITIPASVEEIGDYLFKDCNNLTKITLDSDYLPENIGSNAFSGCPNLNSISRPSITQTNNLNQLIYF